MRCPTLSELPPPPPGKTGWPWTVESAAHPDVMSDGRPWPKVSIVTPSYNQGQFIEETIRSVLLQGYPDIEYIIMDGGSTDSSVKIIKRYERWITHWETCRDNGQAHAINKGIARCSGCVFQYVNSDDLLAEGCLSDVVPHLVHYDAVAGRLNIFSGAIDRPDTTVILSGLSTEDMLHTRQGSCFYQPSFWVRLPHVRSIRGYDERFHYSFDVHMAIRYLERRPNVFYLNKTIGHFRHHPASKSIAAEERFWEDEDEIRRDLSAVLQCRRHRRSALLAFRRRKWRARVDRVLRGEVPYGTLEGMRILVSWFAMPHLSFDPRGREISSEILSRLLKRARRRAVKT